MINRRKLIKIGIASTAAIALPGCMNSNSPPIQISSKKMKTLGLIGGTSWHSTIDYYRYLNEIVEQRLDPPTNPPLLMYSLNVDLLRRDDWDEINQAYLDFSLNLQQAGADAIVICANTPHKVCPFVEPKLNIPFIHIADAIGAEANAQGLNNLGLLGTLPTMEEDFIKSPLVSKFKIQTKVPGERARKQMHKVVVEELTRGIFKDETKRFVIDEMEQLKLKGVNGIILGCTELPMLVKQKDFDLPLLDTTYLHANMAVDFILS